MSTLHHPSNPSNRSNRLANQVDIVTNGPNGAKASNAMDGPKGSNVVNDERIISMVNAAHKPMSIKQLALALNENDESKLTPVYFRDLRNSLHRLRFQKKIYEDYQHRWLKYCPKAPKPSKISKPQKAQKQEPPNTPPVSITTTKSTVTIPSYAAILKRPKITPNNSTRNNSTATNFSANNANMKTTTAAANNSDSLAVPVLNQLTHPANGEGVKSSWPTPSNSPALIASPRGNVNAIIDVELKSTNPNAELMTFGTSAASVMSVASDGTGDDISSLEVRVDPNDIGELSQLSQLSQLSKEDNYSNEENVNGGGDIKVGGGVDAGIGVVQSDVAPHTFMPMFPAAAAQHWTAMYGGGASVQPPPLPQNPPYVVTVIDAISFPEALRVIPTNCICVRRFIFTPITLLVQPTSEIDVIDVIQPTLILSYPQQHPQQHQNNQNVQRQQYNQNERMQNESEGVTPNGSPDGSSDGSRGSGGSVPMALPTTAAFRVLSTLVRFAQFNESFLQTTVVNIFSRDPLMKLLPQELLPFNFNVEIIDQV